MENNSLSTVLQSLLKEHKMSGIKLAKAISLPPQTVNRLVSGQVRDPKASTLQSIADYFSLTLDQLMGHEPLYPSDDNLRGQRTQAIQHFIVKDGMTTLIPDIHPFHWPLAFNQRQHYFAVTLKTKRYEPLYRSGSTLIIDKKQSPQNHDVILLQLDNAVMLKQFLQEGKDTYFHPIITGQQVLNAAEISYNKLGLIVEILIRLKK